MFGRLELLAAQAFIGCGAGWVGTSVGGGGEAAPGGAGHVCCDGPALRRHALPDRQAAIARHGGGHVRLRAVCQPCDRAPAHMPGQYRLSWIRNAERVWVIAKAASHNKE